MKEEYREWDKMSINEQFSSAKYAENRYYSNKIEIAADRIEKQLENVTMYGSDYVQPNIEYRKNAILYKIKGIDTNCSIAVQFEDTTNYYVYVKQDYTTNTLEELIENLNLKENINFNLVTYYETIDNNDVQFDFSGVSEDVIWKMLFSNTNEEYGTKDYSDRIRIAAKSKLFGSNHTSFTVTENGYLLVDIDYIQRMSFYIGEKKAKAFFNYVFDNYEAEATVYVYEPEEDNDPGTIMVMENTL